MTDQRDETPLTVTDGNARNAADQFPGLLSRRAMLQGVSATVPTILTLNSGAVLARARSSNLISTIQAAEGDVLCLDPESTQGPTRANPNVYDLGAPPYGEITRIPVANSYQTKDTVLPLTPAEVCRYEGTIQVNYGDGTLHDRARTPGVMVSNAARASFGARILQEDI